MVTAAVREVVSEAVVIEAEPSVAAAQGLIAAADTGAGRAPTRGALIEPGRAPIHGAHIEPVAAVSDAPQWGRHGALIAVHHAERHGPIAGRTAGPTGATREETAGSTGVTREETAVMPAQTGGDTGKENAGITANIAAGTMVKGTAAVIADTGTIMPAGGMPIRGGSMRFRFITMNRYTGWQMRKMHM
ncbi:MAG: hypothetical protein ACR2OR_16560 [Hyphomicrobiales bacterium]